MTDLEQLNNPIAEAYWRALIAKEVETFLKDQSVYTDSELLLVIKGKR
jgi:hypothetical protein